MPAYVKHVWADDPGGGTPIDAATLNEMETGIDRASIVIVTALPGSPVHGDEVYYEVESGLLWPLVYDSTIVDDLKWLSLGGPPLFVEILTAETTGSTSYANLSTVGPSVTVPLDGEYEIDYGCQASNSVDTRSQFATAKLGAAAASDVDNVRSVAASANGRDTVSRKLVRTLDAAAVVLVQYKVQADTGTFLNRWLSVRPLRVG